MARKKPQQKKKKHKKVKSGTEPSLYYEEPTQNKKIEIEYITAGLDEFNPLYNHFQKAFEKLGNVALDKEGEKQPGQERSSVRDSMDMDGRGPGRAMQQDEEPEEDKPLSRKQQKMLKRLDVAQLKQLVARPDVVEVHDATAADPKMLIYLKSYRNTVPVPSHWSQKRKYLQGKRGIDKPPFQLPAFIADTGITKIRDAYMEREEQKKAKIRAKDKVQPKMGKIDIDYQVLHDAFFKYQTKPKMTKHGDLYYEGKEFEVRLPEHRPGVLSERLKKALGMPDGAPPPWLINMQRYGPPPGQPNMKIPGLNAPIPPGASFGYHPGGWGKPPVDKNGNPLYGDVFGTEQKDESSEPVDVRLWGEPEDDESEEEIEDEEMDEDVDEEGFSSTAPPLSEVTETVTESATGTDTGTETPDIVQIKKFGRDEPRALYQTLEVQKASVGTNLMGSAYTYAMPGKQDVELSLNPAELERLEADPNMVQEKYDHAMEEQTEKRRAEREGIDEVYAEEMKKRAQKNKGKDKKAAHKAFKF